MFHYERNETKINGFDVIHVTHANGQDLRVTLTDVHIPFGINKNGSIKLDIISVDDEKTNKGLRIIESLERQCETRVSEMLEKKVHKPINFLTKKRYFVPNVMAYFEYKNRRLVSDVSRTSGLPLSEKELKGYRGKAILKFKSFWVEENKMFGKWKIEKLILT